MEKKRRTSLPQLSCDDFELNLSISDLVRLYDFDVPDLTEFAGCIIDDGKIDSKRVFSLAESAARGELKEPPSILKNKKG